MLTWRRIALCVLLMVAATIEIARPLATRQPPADLPQVLEALGNIDHERIAIIRAVEWEAQRPVRFGNEAVAEFVAARKRGQRVDGPVRVLRKAVESYAGLRPKGRSDQADALVEEMVEGVIAAYEAQALRLYLARTALHGENGPAFATDLDRERFDDASATLNEAVRLVRSAGDRLGEWVAERVEG